MKSPFINTFITLIDSLLMDQYDKPISRKDYLSFFESFEKRMSRNENEIFHSVEINDHTERLKWGRINYNEKRFWKLSQILSTLKEKNIIECTGYLPNTHSRRYSYTTAFYNAIDLSSFDILYEDINEKIYNVLKNLNTYDETNPQYILLKSNRFYIDVNKCIEWLMDSYKDNQISKDNCLLNVRRVNDINNKDIYVVRGDNGRVYTSFTSLKRELKKYCYIDGKPLLSIDLKSAQPYLLASYLYKKYPNESDVITFYNLVTEGDIYNWTMDKINCTEAVKINNRDECKVEFYRFIFKKTNKGPVPVQKLIKDSLPSLYNIIKSERNELNRNNSTIANYLQSEEAQLFIPVCESFPLECLSVHDSLYFTGDIECNVREKLEFSFSSRSLTKYKLI